MKRLDAEKVMNDLDCRSKYDPDDPLHRLPDPDFEPNCKDCKYYYDYGGCDLEQMLDDGSNAIQEFLSTRHCGSCYWRYKNPDDCDHWIPCKVMKTDYNWGCADWRHPYD